MKLQNNFARTGSLFTLKHLVGKIKIGDFFKEFELLQYLRPLGPTYCVDVGEQ